MIDHTHTLAPRTARDSARDVMASSRVVLASGRGSRPRLAASWASALSGAVVGATITILVGLSACQGEAPDPATMPAGETPLVINAQVDDKSRLYNLIGRWYPSSEVQRLRDDSITPDEWCKSPPVKLVVLADSVEVHCSATDVHTAPLARVRTTTNTGELILTLRVGKDAPLRQLRFENIQGPRARITGSPCPQLESAPYERFPEYEVLTRQILNGRRCSQFEAQ